MKHITMGQLRAATADVPDDMPIIISTEGYYHLAEEIQVNAPPGRFRDKWPEGLKFEAVCLETY